jgi:hypothetical protein
MAFGRSLKLSESIGFSEVTRLILSKPQSHCEIGTIYFRVPSSHLASVIEGPFVAECSYRYVSSWMRIFGISERSWMIAYRQRYEVDVILPALGRLELSLFVGRSSDYWPLVRWMPVHALRRSRRAVRGAWPISRMHSLSLSAFDACLVASATRLRLEREEVEQSLETLKHIREMDTKHDNSTERTTQKLPFSSRGYPSHRLAKIGLPRLNRLRSCKVGNRVFGRPHDGRSRRNKNHSSLARWNREILSSSLGFGGARAA